MPCARKVIEFSHRAMWVALALAAVSCFGQTTPTVAPPPPTQDERGADSDPTRPVIWSLRNEYYGAPGDRWNNAFIVRWDRAFLRKKRKFPGGYGILARFDMPFVVAHAVNQTQGGLGDLYAQIVVVPYRHQKSFALAAGSGFSIPTATDRLLGTGKFELAPLAGPVWFIKGRGLFLLKFQDYISVAGDASRRDVHYFTFTPLLVLSIPRSRYWVQIDGEAKDNFERVHGQGGYKAGLLFGRLFKGGYGVWIKPEVYWGPARDADFAIKTSFFHMR